MSLQLQCPECGCGFDLREARNDQEWREFCTLLIQFPQDVQIPLLHYLELFRPAKHPNVRSSVMLKLANELLPQVKAQAITRKHSTYTVTHAVWAGAMMHLSNTRASLQLPLKGNGYLLETLANRQEKLAHAAEAKAIEVQRQAPQRAGSGMRQAGEVAQAALDQPAPRTPELTPEQREANMERIRKMLDDAFAEKAQEQQPCL